MVLKFDTDETNDKSVLVKRSWMSDQWTPEKYILIILQIILQNVKGGIGKFSPTRSRFSRRDLSMWPVYILSFHFPLRQQWWWTPTGKSYYTYWLIWLIGHDDIYNDMTAWWKPAEQISASFYFHSFLRSFAHPTCDTIAMIMIMIGMTMILYLPMTMIMMIIIMMMVRVGGAGQ